VGDYTVKGTLVQDFEQLAQRVLFSKVVDSKTRAVLSRGFAFSIFASRLLRYADDMRVNRHAKMRDLSCATRRQASFPCGRWYSAVYGTRLYAFIFVDPACPP
jgi:hypothetical protein